MSEAVFTKNIEAMNKWYPEFVRLLEEARSNTDDDAKIEVQTSLDGETVFRVHKDERTLYLGGKRNAKEPIRLFSERMGEIHSHATVFLYGIGSGSYLQSVIESTQESVTVVVYEPSFNIFMAALENIDMSVAIESRPIAFIVEGVNEVEYEPVMRKTLATENLEFLKEDIHPNYAELYGEKIKEHIQILQRYVESIMVNYNTSKSLSIRLASNILCNLKYICDGYTTGSLFRAIPHDVPAILVSAGPSLNKNMEELRRAKNKAFIIAVDTALKPLLKAGILLDAYATIDANKNMILFNMDEINDIPVVAPPVALADIIANNRARKIFYFDGHILPWQLFAASGKRFPEINMGGSVACCAFSLLYKMGFDTIILVGQDLAYTGGKSHADGTYKDSMPVENTENFTMVKGNYEDKVPTYSVMRIFKEWFEKHIEIYKNSTSLRVINATEGGAYIEGTELMTLSEAIDETCDREVNFTECIRNMESDFNAEERQKAVEFVHKIPDELAKIESSAKQLKSAYKKLQSFSKSGSLDKSAATKILKRIRRIDNRIHKMVSYELIEVSMPVADYIMRSEYYYDNNDSIEEELAVIARQGLMYTDLLQECAGLLKQCAEENLLCINQF